MTADHLCQNWSGMINDDLKETIEETFGLAPNDTYLYRAESFAMTLTGIDKQMQTGNMRWTYQVHGKLVEIPNSDIQAYASIFASTTDTAKALTAFKANAKKGSPREAIATYLVAKRVVQSSVKVPKLKTPHVNPYYDVWAWSCRSTGFLGPYDDPHYADPQATKQTHPMLPVLYHHFGCVCPSYEALSIISQSAGPDGILEMASGNGYWTYMLRRLGVQTVAVDNMEAIWRTMWVDDTIKANGLEYLKRHRGASRQTLLLVYMVTKGDFTKQVLKSFQGDCVIVVGTQNINRYTSFADVTVEEYFRLNKPDFELTCRIALPSFAGKDEGMYVYQRGSMQS